MRRLRLAIVGCGSITERGLLPHLMLERDRVEVTSLCDISRPRLKTLAERFHVRQTFTSLPDMLHDSDEEAIAIATPIQLHYQQALESLLNGRHVYLQKTMTQTGQEARTLIQIARKHDLLLAASPGQMLLPAYKRAHELVQSGALGTVYAAIGVNIASGHEREKLRTNSAQPGAALDPSWYYRAGGGPLRDMGVYPFHAITGILGRARRVISFSNRPIPERHWNGKRIRVEVDDNVVLSLELEQNRLATISTAFSANLSILHWGHLAISGSEGALEVRRLPGRSSSYELVVRRVGEPKAETQAFGTGLGETHDALDEAHVARDLLDFVEAVLNSREPGASAEHAYHVIEIIEAAERAAQTASAVTVLDSRSDAKEV
ncbi:MAG: Gfo/Idh/MocA family protein [Candidatus Geothermarchaeales archaeon]